MPKLEFVDGIVKCKPNQKGVYRVLNEINAEYNINANGWNSIHDRYNIKRSRNKYRIVIVGDSYVEALQVNYYESLAEQLEEELGKDSFEVYRFGMSGAPMSQYLYIIRREVLAYKPDLIVVVLLHNDFVESYQTKSGVYTSSFLKLEVGDGGVIKEIKPRVLQKRWYSPIQENSAIWKFFAYWQQFRFDFLRNLIFEVDTIANKYQANIPMSTIEVNQVSNEAITNYIFSELKKETEPLGIELLVVIDGDRLAIYDNNDSDYKKLYDSGALSLNLIAKGAAERNNIHFIDLHPVFKMDFEENRKKFSFESDNHWNVYAHKIVANTIYEYIKSYKLMSQK